jgi:hypothetical protein
MNELARRVIKQLSSVDAVHYRHTFARQARIVGVQRLECRFGKLRLAQE